MEVEGLDKPLVSRSDSDLYSDESSSSSSQSSDENDSHNNADIQDPIIHPHQLEALKQAVATSPWSYDAHIAHINAIRKTYLHALSSPYQSNESLSVPNLNQHQLWVQLEQAREEMAKQLPLSPRVWIEWVEDILSRSVTKIGDNDDDAGRADDSDASVAPRLSPQQGRRRAHELYQRAISDYLSAELLLRWVRIIMGRFIMNELTLDDHKAILTSCPVDTRYDTGNPSAPIDIVRLAFETAITRGGLDCANAALIWRAYQGFETQHGDRAMQVVSRMVMVPYLGLEQDLAELQANKEISQVLSTKLNDIERAKKMLHERLTWEQRFEHFVQAQTSPGYLDWDGIMFLKHYIELEKKADPGRAMTLYERSLSLAFLEPSLWLSYGQYAAYDLKDMNLAKGILHRAVRNVPWNPSVWCMLMRIQEALDNPLEEIFKSFQFASTHMHLSQVVTTEISFSLLHCASRHIEIKDSMDFKELLDRIIKVHPEGSWERCETVLRASKICISKFKDISLAKEWIESEILKYKGKEPYWWSQYTALLEKEGRIDDARRVFKRAIFVVSTLETLDSIGNFWQELEGIYGSVHDYGQMEHVIEKRRQDLKQIEEKRLKKEGKKHTRTEKIQSNMKKRRTEHDEAMTTDTPSAHKLNRKQRRELKRQGILVDCGHREEKTDTTKSKKNDRVEVEPGVIFVSNLSFATKTEDIEEYFSGQCTNMNEVRLVKRRDGASKGFAYIEFSSEEGVQDALKLHMSYLQGRQIWVRRSKPKHAHVATQESVPMLGSGGGLRRGGRAASFFPRTSLQKRELTEIPGEESQHESPHDDAGMKVETTHEEKDQVPKNQNYFRSLLK